MHGYLQACTIVVDHRFLETCKVSASTYQIMQHDSDSYDPCMLNGLRSSLLQITVSASHVVAEQTVQNYFRHFSH